MKYTHYLVERNIITTKIANIIILLYIDLTIKGQRQKRYYSLPTKSLHTFLKATYLLLDVSCHNSFKRVDRKFAPLCQGGVSLMNVVISYTR